MTFWWAKIFVFSSAVQFVFSDYKTYYVEDDCVFGNETFTYTLGPPLGQSSAAILKTSRYESYSDSKNCTFHLKPSEISQNSGVVLSIKEIDFIHGSTFGCANYIKILNSIAKHPKPICGYTVDGFESRTYWSLGEMSILYHTEDRIPPFRESGFHLIATAYRKKPCGSNEFPCENNRCIWKGLRCDGHNNCGDKSDERFDLCEQGMQDVFQRDNMIITVCAVLVFVIAILNVAFCCLRNKRSVSARSSVDQPPTISPFEAIHPSGYAISQNPAGPNSLYAPLHQSIKNQEGFSNPCYPNGFPQAPPPPYNP